MKFVERFFWNVVVLSSFLALFVAPLSAGPDIQSIQDKLENDEPLNLTKQEKQALKKQIKKKELKKFSSIL